LIYGSKESIIVVTNKEKVRYMREWDELTELEQIQVYYSDLHKSAHGSRFCPDWETVEDARESYERLSIEADAIFESERVAEAEAFIAWKAHLRGLVQMGASDIPTALIWDMDAEDAEHDPGYYCFKKRIDYDKEPLIERLLRIAA